MAPPFRGYWTELRADPPGDRQVHPGWFIGRLIASGYGPSIPVIVSYILHRRRWFIGPFRDARPPPPPPIISDRPSPGGPEIRNRFRAPPFYRPPPTIYPPLCLLPVPQEDAAPNSILLAAILLVPNTALSRCFVWKEEDSKVTDVKFRREIRIKGDFSNLEGRKGGWELYNLIEWTVTMFLRSRGCLSGVWPVKNERVNEGWISDWISLPRSNNFGIIFEGRIMAIYRSLGKLGNNAARSMMISTITTVPGCTFRTDPEFRITA